MKPMREGMLERKMSNRDTREGHRSSEFGGGDRRYNHGEELIEGIVVEGKRFDW